jgi:hypothetical protein
MRWLMRRSRREEKKRDREVERRRWAEEGYKFENLR